MEFVQEESVGAGFSNRLIVESRDRTVALINEAASQIVPGMAENEARQIVKDLFQAFESEKFWHASQVRFGVNTLRAFGEPGEADVILRQNDIFFLDLGPIFLGHEGDVGRSFVVGDDPEMKKMVADIKDIWTEVRNRWVDKEENGTELYSFAREVTEKRGWLLNLKKADGHRISDFPHAAKMRGSIDGLSYKPSALRWILEIQIQHPTKPYGAFYEDLLV